MVLVDGAGYSAGSLPGRGVPDGGHAPRTNARESADPGGPERLIADRGYDSNAVRRFLKRRRIQPIIPARSNNTQATDQDGRCLRRYRRRWIVERTIGCARQLPAADRPV